jgi:hypothetical protein
MLDSPNPPSRAKPRSNPQVDSLLEISTAAFFFVTPTGQPFVGFPLGRKGHYVLPLRSPLFQYWLLDNYVRDHNNTPPRESAWREAFRAILARAHCRPRVREYVYRRVGARADPAGPARFTPKTIALDLRNDNAQVVEITRKRWKVASGSSFHFQVSRDSLQLPRPVTPKPDAADLDLLRSLLNLPDRRSCHRVLAWLLAALRPTGPYPILALQGPSGSAKSTAARFLRALIDPSRALLQHLPSSRAELFGLACRNWVLAFDHASHITERLSDALCSLSAGSDVLLKEPYERREPVSIELQRPILMTADTWTPRAALARRALVVSLPPVPPERRRPEADLWRDFEAARPRLLGLLCTAVSAALARIPAVRLDPSPHLADAAMWAVAAAPALHISEADMLAAVRSEELPPGPPSLLESIRALLQHRDTWNGAAAELLDLLPHWPGSPVTLHRDLRTLAPQLSTMDISVRFTTVRGRRQITLRRHIPPNAPACSPPS